MLTLLAVFRDIIPAYRIRPMQEEEEGADKASSKATSGVLPGPHAVQPAVVSMHACMHACSWQCCGAPGVQHIASSSGAGWLPLPLTTLSSCLSVWMPQLSKEVRALRTHEAALLAGYHTYLKALLQVGGPGLAWPGWLPELAPVALEEAAEGALPLLATPGAFASIH